MFTFAWRHDPRKDEAWAARERARLGPVAFAREHELDYGAALEDVCIPYAWVEAGRELHRRLAGRVGVGRSRAGLDVGAGRAESVLVLRDGPLVHPPEVGLDPDSLDLAWWALGRCGQRGARELLYDSVGVGHGLGAAFARAGMADLEARAVNAGEPASGAVWPDGRTSREKFANLRAELWWKAREALGRSRELLRHLRGEPEGVAHPLGEVLLLPEDEALARQLASLRWFRTETGKVLIEDKERLRRRGVRSPDRADALVLTFHEPPAPVFFVA